MSELPGTSGLPASAAPAPSDGPDGVARPWLVTLTRAVLALALGIATAFTGGHSPRFGLLLFAVWAVAAAIVTLVAVLRPGPAGLPAVVRRPLSIEVIVLAVAAGSAFSLAGSETTAVPLSLVLAVGLTALLLGALDLRAGIRARGATPLARELVLVGAITLLLAVLALIVPPSLRQSFPGAEGHPGVLTASTIVTGFLGGWGFVTGVLLAIATVGLRGGPVDDASALPPSTTRRIA